ncbi:xanthine dehydrogenase accessory protein XdhC [Endobacterium cereale]|uniref:xanthine dehydrogenase accessory protein XdhC n=1 Tax=Endobacterium cereale TaxID=2663029 RepID=UPI002B473DA9|nr:xanthine dehydrogenase accessory protein XdhC [Endobacterium cereale]MEB2842905.1 xanthine dehydrogenase accessory protein XdhC [Endobacterium cereale]
MQPLSALDFLAEHSRSVLVEVTEAKGSTPRDAGAFMLVSRDAIWGTIGGGQLEYMAIDNAHAFLCGNGLPEMNIPLGPDIGQCCGGRTRLAFTPMTPVHAENLRQRLEGEHQTLPHISLFGAGHVGRALARALCPLPFKLTVVETRAEELQSLPSGIGSRLTALPEAEVAKMPAGSAVLILTHDHALDFLIARAALARQDLAYVGMIGSATKRATFAHWLKREGEDESLMRRLTLPIGGNVVRDKRPEVIAALVAAELLTVYAARQEMRSERQVAYP